MVVQPGRARMHAALSKKELRRTLLIQPEHSHGHHTADQVVLRWPFNPPGHWHRDVEELLAERGIHVDHVTVYRWVQTFTAEFLAVARPRLHVPGDRWFVDETYVKIAGRWTYLHRAVDQHGQVIDVLLSTRRDRAAARVFFTRALRPAVNPGGLQEPPGPPCQPVTPRKPHHRPSSACAATDSRSPDHAMTLPGQGSARWPFIGSDEDVPRLASLRSAVA